MKRAELYERAERLYIDGRMTYAEIAAQLGVVEKTIWSWAQEGGWQRKREEYTRNVQSLDTKLYDFVHKLMASIQSDWDAGNQVDPGRLYALTRLIDKLEKARQFEGAVKADAQSAESAAQKASAEEIENKVKELLGIQ